MSQPKRFQLFQPIGGAVIGTTGVAADAAGAATTRVEATSSMAARNESGFRMICTNLRAAIKLRQ